MLTRVPVLDVRPLVEGGRRPVRAVQDEELTVRAVVLGERRAVVRAAVVLTGPDGRPRSPVPMVRVSGDEWATTIAPDAVGDWTYRVASWHDPLAAWARDAPTRLEAEVDVEQTLAEGAALLRRAAEVDPVAGPVADDLLDTSVPPLERLAEALTVTQSLPRDAVRDHEDATEPLPLRVDRERALVGAWYEMFPRSEGARLLADGTVVPGTLRTAAKRLEAVAAMGFDVVCLPPIHPIGRTGRIGPDGRSPAGPEDPGSPWAVGSPDGGHDAVDPALGTLEDVAALVERAQQLGMEVALDLALRCSPDHPWVTEHPEWFVRRPDGTPVPGGEPLGGPSDVLRLDFDTDPVGLYVEVLRVVAGWLEQGIRVFRVHEAHDAPLAFWEQLLQDLRALDPDVVVLAAGHASSASALALATVGFHQVHTALPWREGVADVTALLVELADRTSDVLRPHLLVNGADLLPRALHGGDAAVFGARAALAALGGPTWGVSAGFELLEQEPLEPGSLRPRHSDVHEVRVRDWDAPHSIAPFLTRLNEVRRAHPALRRLRNLALHRVDHAGVVAFSKVTGDDVVVVVIDLFPAFAKTVTVRVTPEELGLRPDVASAWRDDLDGSAAQLDAVALDRDCPVRVLSPRR